MESKQWNLCVDHADSFTQFTHMVSNWTTLQHEQSPACCPTKQPEDHVHTAYIWSHILEHPDWGWGKRLTNELQL